MPKEGRTRRAQAAQARVVRRALEIVAGFSTITLAVAAWTARRTLDEVDHSNLLAVLSMPGIAGVVTGSAGRLAVRVPSYAGGVCAVVGYVAYLASEPWAPWAFVTGAVSSAFAFGLSARK